MWKAIQQITFTGNREWAGNTSMFFIVEEVKETALTVHFFVLMTILNFWTKGAQKGIFDLKNKKIRITIKFYIFELV